RERTVVEQHDRQTDVRAIGQIGRERRDLDFRPGPQVGGHHVAHVKRRHQSSRTIRVASAFIVFSKSSWLPPSGGRRTPAAALRLTPEATSLVFYTSFRLKTEATLDEFTGS